MATVVAMAAVVGTANAFAYGDAIVSAPSTVSGVLRAIGTFTGDASGAATVVSLGTGIQRGVGSSAGVSLLFGFITDGNIGGVKVEFEASSRTYAFPASSGAYVFPAG